MVALKCEVLLNQAFLQKEIHVQTTVTALSLTSLISLELNRSIREPLLTDYSVINNLLFQCMHN